MGNKESESFHLFFLLNAQQCKFHGGQNGYFNSMLDIRNVV